MFARWRPLRDPDNEMKRIDERDDTEKREREKDGRWREQQAGGNLGEAHTQIDSRDLIHNDAINSCPDLAMLTRFSRIHSARTSMYRKTRLERQICHGLLLLNY